MDLTSAWNLRMGTCAPTAGYNRIQGRVASRSLRIGRPLEFQTRVDYVEAASWCTFVTQLVIGKRWTRSLRRRCTSVFSMGGRAWGASHVQVGGWGTGGCLSIPGGSSPICAIRPDTWTRVVRVLRRAIRMVHDSNWLSAGAFQPGATHAHVTRRAGSGVHARPRRARTPSTTSATQSSGIFTRQTQWTCGGGGSSETDCGAARFADLLATTPRPPQARRSRPLPTPEPTNGDLWTWRRGKPWKGCRHRGARVLFPISRTSHRQ